MEEAVFLPSVGGFVPTTLALSPWSPQLLHGGPPAGLLAYAIEGSMRGDLHLHPARLTVDLFRPVPNSLLTVSTRLVRTGRRIAVVEASLFSEGVEVSRATGLFLRRVDVPIAAANLPPPASLPGPDGIETGKLSSVLSSNEGGVEEQRMSGSPGFHTTIEVRRASGQAGERPTAAWIRIPAPLIAGMETTPLMRAAATSDFGNALGHVRAGEGMGFINADISLYLHRLPEGEWIGLETTSAAEPHGVGVVESVMHDAAGPVGRVVQAILANPRAPGMRGNSAK